VKVGTGHSTGRADQSNHLSATHRVSHGHQLLAHVEVGGDYAATMIHIDDVSREEEIVHQRDDAPVGGADLFAGGSAKIDAQMPGRQLAVENSA